MPTPLFATFWHGPFNPTVYSCAASFAACGANLRVYTYEPGLDAPKGVEVADARSICPDESLLHRYSSGGKPSVATFSDRFRYDMIRQTDCCWVDADIICLTLPDFGADDIILGRQPKAHGKALINNAVMKLPPDHPVLDEMLAEAERLVDVDISWGAIGPFMLTEICEKHGIYQLARDPSDFYPIGPDQFWQLLLPSYREAVQAAVRGATFLHLWSELLRRSSYDVSRRPPVGSYLHDIFLRLETLDRIHRRLQRSGNRCSPGRMAAGRGRAQDDAIRACGSGSTREHLRAHHDRQSVGRRGEPKRPGLDAELHLQSATRTRELHSGVCDKDAIRRTLRRLQLDEGGALP